MPKRKRSYAYKKRRRKVYGKRKKYRKRAPIQRLSVLNPPNKAIVRLVYHTAGNTNVTANAPMRAFHFCANGLFQPAEQNGNGQPMLFDQMMEKFDHYTVLKSFITIRFYKDSTSSNEDPNHLAAIVQDQPRAHPLDLIKYREQPGVSYCTFLGAKKIATLKRSFVASKFFGKKINADSELRGTVSSNPAEKAYFSFYCSDKEAVHDGDTSAVNPLYYEARITYLAVFTEPKKWEHS